MKLFELKAPVTLTFIGWTSFFSQGSSDLKINRGLLIVMTNLHVKYEDCWPKHYKVIERTSFQRKGPCDLWPLNQQGSPWSNSMPNKKIVYQRILRLLGGQAFRRQGPCDLYLWLSDLKINRGHLMVMTNFHAKYADCGSKDSLVIGRTSFLKSSPVDLWPQNQ
jgi:hypothetical protein